MSFKFFENVSKDSAKLIVPPEKIPPNSTKALSAMWDRGKYENHLSDSSKGTSIFKFWVANEAEKYFKTTPLGIPVVPEVYIIEKISSRFLIGLDFIGMILD